MCSSDLKGLEELAIEIHDSAEEALEILRAEAEEAALRAEAEEEEQEAVEAEATEDNAVTAGDDHEETLHEVGRGDVALPTVTDEEKA